MKKIKNYIIPIICILTILLQVTFLEETTSFITSYILTREPVITDDVNIYKKDYSLSFAENTDTFIPYSYQDLINILYTSINSGWDQFTFYCPEEYPKCIFDIGDISQDSNILTHINNFVHPYNSFTNIKMVISETGEINLDINYLYSGQKIHTIDTEVDKLIDELITEEQTDKEKIKTIHDHIINTTKYDSLVNDNLDTPYESSTAYGPLFEGYAICNGYTDLMAIFLTKLGYKNVKIATTPEEISYSNTGHVWNAVYLDNKWLHLDLTWDDPLPSDPDSERDYLLYSYFLVDTETMNQNDETLEKANDNKVLEEHHFSNTIYYEIINNIE